MSKNKLNELGRRLATSVSVSEEDDALLKSVVRAYQIILDEIKIQLQVIGLEATSRVKTRDILIGKLKREHGMELARVQDLAGARIVAKGNRTHQDAVVQQIVEHFRGLHSKEPKVSDRRLNPSFGYRAVHVIVYPEGVPVEIQIRTELQNHWAQIIESLADRWGRDIRYGAEPQEPNRRVSGFRTGRRAKPITRATVVRDLRGLGDVVDGVERAETTWSRFDDLGPLSRDVAVFMDAVDKDRGAPCANPIDYYNVLRARFKGHLTRTASNRRYAGRLVRRMVPKMASITIEELQDKLDQCDKFVTAHAASHRKTVREAYEAFQRMLYWWRHHIEHGGLR